MRVIQASLEIFIWLYKYSRYISFRIHISFKTNSKLFIWSISTWNNRYPHIDRSIVEVFEIFIIWFLQVSFIILQLYNFHKGNQSLSACAAKCFTEFSRCWTIIINIMTGRRIYDINKLSRFMILGNCYFTDLWIEWNSFNKRVFRYFVSNTATQNSRTHTIFRPKKFVNVYLKKKKKKKRKNFREFRIASINYVRKSILCVVTAAKAIAINIRVIDRRIRHRKVSSSLCPIFFTKRQYNFIIFLCTWANLFFQSI